MSESASLLLFTSCLFSIWDSFLFPSFGLFLLVIFLSGGVANVAKSNIRSVFRDRLTRKAVIREDAISVGRLITRDGFVFRTIPSHYGFRSIVT